MAPRRPTETSALGERLRERVRVEGPLTFAAFMEAALYDPHGGFYSRDPIGERADFVTSPHVSRAFGTLLAAQVVEFWELLQRPDRFDVVEAGAGSGVLARQILENLPADLAARVRYQAIDRSPAARAGLATLALGLGTDIQVGTTLADADADDGLVGCLIANELLDNLPFHRIRGTERGIVELFVSDRGDGFALTEGPASDPRIEQQAIALARGEEAVVNLQALDLLEQAARRFQRGYLWLCDYGWTSDAPNETAAAAHLDFVHGYRGHRFEEDVLTEPGSRDITAGVDFGALARRAQDLGLHVWGPTSQRDALLSLGYREWDEQARNNQVRATADRDGLAAMRTYSERNRAAQLVDPMGLGSFLVLCLGVGAVPDDRPRSVRRDGEGGV
jgi:SAM-dependent MidA family methyltransferase